MRLDAMADDTLIDDAALAFDAVSFIPPYNEFTGEPQATAPPFVPSYEKANARPPEDAAPPIDVRHFKTRLCVYLASGSCPHGARCFFAHSVRRPGVFCFSPPKFAKHDPRPRPPPRSTSSGRRPRTRPPSTRRGRAATRSASAPSPPRAAASSPTASTS